MFRPWTAAAGFLTVQSAGVVAEAPTPFPFCSWWTETIATTVNVAFPDFSAAYWTTPFAVANDLRFFTDCAVKKWPLRGSLRRPPG